MLKANLIKILCSNSLACLSYGAMFFYVDDRTYELMETADMSFVRAVT
jgi:hypothetical protein